MPCSILPNILQGDTTMAQVSISADDQERIAEAVRDFMQDEGILGEVILEFTENFTVDDKGGGTECCSKKINRRWINQCPCR